MDDNLKTELLESFDKEFGRVMVIKNEISGNGYEPTIRGFLSQAIDRAYEKGFLDGLNEMRDIQKSAKSLKS